jgi:membrane glycosyltransferase
MSPDAAATPRITRVPRPWRGTRVLVIFSAAVTLTGVVSIIFADLLWRTGWSASRTVLLTLFVILFFLGALGCMHGLFGFVLRRIGGENRLTRLKEFRNQSITATSTAIVFPVFNENPARVCEGLRATYESLEKTGQIERFDFFILSDSTNPEKWIEEERRWFDLVRELNALGRIFYRRRVHNEGKKSGNIRDFLNNWGRRYRYFICCDADSVMRGETIVSLVQLMEVHPTVGLIQTVPGLVNGESLFGRIQQFANRLYAPVFITGLNFWAQNAGNYWGHNAIIRTEAFMHCCDLPQLPGRKPFGGHILSHDFVEAALMLKENWEVWFAHDLEGSYEEAPQGLIENAQRDRRWCQGNMQHGMLIFAKGLRGISRMHLLLGIFGYLSGPLWLAFLLTFNWMRWFHEYTGLSEIPPVRGRIPLELSATEHAFLVFFICMFVLMLPKALALIDLALDSKRRREFGGVTRTAVSVVAETVFSTLHAPLQMLWHTRFVVTILLGREVNWGAQKRDADGTPWGYAARHHASQTAIGIIWGALVWRLDPTTFWWFAPVLVGMIVCVPLSVLTSRSSYGGMARKLGLFLTPEETNPREEISLLRARMKSHEESRTPASTSPNAAITDVVLDPYVNAIHVSLLREKRLNPVYAAALARLGVGQDRVRSLGEKLLAVGPDALESPEKILLLSDADVMSWLHRRAWIRSNDTLAPWWQTAIAKYAR